MLVSARNGIIPKTCGFVSSGIFVIMLFTVDHCYSERSGTKSGTMGTVNYDRLRSYIATLNDCIAACSRYNYSYLRMMFDIGIAIPLFIFQ